MFCGKVFKAAFSYVQKVVDTAGKLLVGSV